jgi:hypothetical protein
MGGTKQNNMSGFEITILIGLIVIIAAGVGYYMNHGQPTLKELTKDYYDNGETQEGIELVEELYNKDLRPIVTKKAPKEVVTEVVEEAPKPSKKKRKYYPKKK